MKSNGDEQTQFILRISSFAVAVYVMLWIAIVNGYPIFFNDTGEYLVDSFGMIQSKYRTIIYPVFIRLASWQGSVWLVVIVQSVLTIYLLRCVFDCVFQRKLEPRSDRIYFLTLVLLLAFGTTLPWHVGELMPDVFGGLAFLAAFLLLYDAEMSLERTVILVVTLAISVGSHLANILAVGFLILAALAMKAFRRTRQFGPTRTGKGIAGFLVMPIAIVTILIGFSNYRTGFGFRLSAASPVFVFNTLLENGLAEDYLETQCRVEALTPCKYLHHLPNGEFLWGPHPLLKDMGGWLGAREEASKISWGTIRRYPVRFALDCAKETVRQFVIFEGDSDNENHPIRNGYTADVFSQLYPGDIARYQLTRQSSGQLASMARVMYHFYQIVFWISPCVCLLLLIREGTRFARANVLLFLALIYLVSNAFVCASTSGAFNRYQSRVNWLMALCMGMYVLQFMANRKALVSEESKRG
jgi:hypothetical protein